MAENRRSCASCGAPNEEDARFCEGCGTSLARICATCGVEANVAARFCRGCGAPLDQPTRAPDAPDTGPVRKTVTVMFADLAGSTSFEERVDAETAREVIGGYHELLRTVAQRHRAGVTKYIGDGFMAVWGVPEIGPEDAVRAVDAAVELQERFVDLATWVTEAHSVELALRVAVNTGEVVVGTGDADLVGDALNVCARLESECPRGHVVVGEETWRATRGHYGYESLGEVQVKGRSAPVAAYRWLGRQSESADAAPFVGRHAELDRLQSAMDGAVTARSARLVTIVGDPGVGKSRIAAQFTGAQSEARVIEARCDPEGTVAMAPLIEVLRSTDLESEIPANVPERDRLIRDLGGLAAGEAGSVEENFWALRRFVEVLAIERPVVLVLDDIQWADALLLDFIEHLMEWAADVPVFVLALARPELRELRPELGTVGRFVCEAVHLGGLDPSATAELAANVLGAARLPEELVRRLPSSTEGNPLFVRELVGMLAHDGVLIQDQDSWRLTIDVDAIAVPPTIHALLASRLERLDGVDRRVLEIASVVGSEFSIGAIRALAGGAGTGVTLSLNRLRRLELAQPSGTYVGDEAVWRFHHVLIRDVAYRRLLKSDRADLHERLAVWVETGGASVAFDSDEMVARHLEAAYTYRHQLGALDDRARELAVRAARHYAASAKRALDRDELVSAGTQAARGAALAAADEALHADLLLIGCEAFLSAGDVAAGAPLVDDLERLADSALAPWATCYRCQFVVYTDPERLLEVETRLHEAIDEFSRRRDHAGLAKAHRVRAGARGRLGRIGDSEIDLFEALIAARQSGDHRQITAALGAAPGAALWGPSPVPKAGGRCLDVVRMQRMTTAAPSLEATSLRHLAVLELLRGRPDKARTMLADARQVVADLGLRHGVMETELFAGIIESMEGDPVAAEPHFRTALEGLDALGVGADAGQAAALLARSVLAQGRLEEADRHAAESERLAGRNLKTAIAWRAVRAEIFAAQGRKADAIVMAREAVAVAAGTDLVLDHAEACLALSRVLALAGDTHGANSTRDDANALYAAKEVTMRVGQVAEPAVSPAAAVEAHIVSSRLTLANRATDAGRSVVDALHRRDIDAVTANYSDTFTYDDRRRISGDPINGLEGLRAATERILEHYGRFEMTVLAVRGDRLALASSCLSDNSGNEATDLIVTEIDEGGLIVYEGRFDDDFEGAYRELDRRYWAGDGAEFAEPGATVTEWTLGLNRGDFDTLFDDLTTADFRIENRSRSAFPDRSAREYRRTLEELAAMVVSARAWISVMSWISPNFCVVRCDRNAVGEAGEQYTWHFVIAFEIRDGRVASMCEFEIDDEGAAFGYAQDRARASASRLRISNRASELAGAAWRALQAHDVDALRVDPSDDFVYDDRRRISGDPIEGAAGLHAATERILHSYPYTEWRTMAVRGERLEMHSSRLWDDDGNEARTLNVMEFDDAGRLAYFGRFEEDDFEGAYRELDRRYYADEGALFAESGSVATEWVIALNCGDYAKAFGEFSDPNAGFENRSRSAFPDPSVSDPRTTYEDLNAMVGSTRTWPSALCILSPTLAVGRLEQQAIGPSGEQYLWTWIIVTEMHDGRFGAGCLFELDDEEAAFAYAEERLQTDRPRLTITNQASRTADKYWATMRSHDADGALECCSEGITYDDRRHITGDPIPDRAALRAAFMRIFDQYTDFESSTLAVRGEHLLLGSSQWFSDAGFRTGYLHVIETSDDGRILYEARFDEDDFDGAYRELERRYYAGEGAAFVTAGTTLIESINALNTNDFDRLLGELCTPDMRVENRTRSAFPDRSVSDLRTSFGQLNSMVASTRTWLSAACWVSPDCAVVRFEREAVGSSDEQYSWTRILVIGFRGARMASMCQFELDDEQAAFAFAEELMRARPSRLDVTNRASELSMAVVAALQAHDVDRLMEYVSDRLVYDDRRRLRGIPIGDVREAMSRIMAQYSHFEGRTLAVRGENHHLLWSRWTDDAGNETTHLHVQEFDDGQMLYEGRFDEDDFDGAYRELEERYYSGEGACLGARSAAVTEFALAVNRRDLDRAFSEFTDPDFSSESRSQAIFAYRSASEFRASIEELQSMVTRMRVWYSATSWPSPTVTVSRYEREAAGHDGEEYKWSGLNVVAIRDGRIMSMCQFDVDDEDAAFAYADEQIRTAATRLGVRNRASERANAAIHAAREHDADAMVDCYTEDFVYDDRRRLGGNPIADLRSAIEGILAQYSQFEGRTLAVRGEHLSLSWTGWRNDEGFETGYLAVHEVGEDGRFIYEGRFDEDDFDGAYREFELRYYSGEGAEFAESGELGTEYILSYNRGDFDRMTGELTAPGAVFENRSQSVFPDRSVAEIRESIEELSEMVASARARFSVLRWLSPRVCVARFEREAAGQDGERYTWSRIYVNEISDGRATRSCQFDLEDEEAAFAYAEERLNAAASRLAVTNRSCETALAITRAMQDQSIDGIMELLSEQLVYDDRRRLSGDPIVGREAFQNAFERILEQYSRFEWRVLAVRGDRLNLNTSTWSDDAGNQSGYLHVFEIDEDGRQIYEGRFDQDDFGSACRELEHRYYIGEGSAFAVAGVTATEYELALNQRQYDRMFGELSAPDMRLENRSRSVFPDRSLEEFRTSIEHLDSMISSARTWNSNAHWVSETWSVARQEREAVGLDGERFAWTRIYVGEIRDGRMAALCQFDLDDEAAAFAYAEERARATSSRLAVANRASDRFVAARQAAQAHDADAMVDCYAEGFVYDDRRRLGGNPIVDLRSAVEGILAQYTQFDGRVLAVRGERLCLGWSRWRNDMGFETTYLIVHEVDENGLFSYEGRFDGDDFEGAYRELDERYYASEGAAFAEAGVTPTEMLIAVNRGDFDRAFGDEFVAADAREENRSRLPFPNRSPDAMRASFEELDAMVASARTWFSAMRWLSKVWSVVRFEREAIGKDGEQYTWTLLVVLEIRDGRVTSMCDFEWDDEEAAFAYAEERSRASSSRLAVNNRASLVWNAVGLAMSARDADGVAAHFADSYAYDDRWAVGGDAPADVAAAIQRIFEQYSQFEGRTLAVRGDTLQLATAHWCNDDGYETDYLHVTEINDEGLICYYGRFDANDFEGAYRELEERYYAGEGAYLGAASTTPEIEFTLAVNRRDLDRAFNEFTDPNFSSESRSQAIFAYRSISEFRASIEELQTMVTRMRAWHSATSWPSPTISVSRYEREATGHDGEEYKWSGLNVVESRNGRIMSMCQFDVEDEDAAFAYAEERARATDSRLPLSNIASDRMHALIRSAQIRDLDAMVDCYTEGFVYDDRRKLSGHPLLDLRSTAQRILSQYSEFEVRVLAVRSKHLQLGSHRWSNDSGFETTHLTVNETGEDGRFIYEGRFDEDDFEGAYRELERRFYAGEGAAFAEGGAVALELISATNRGDFDRAFRDLSHSEIRVENRSRSIFQNSSVDEITAAHQQLGPMVASWRMWQSSVRWLSPQVCFTRLEREAVGRDGERYAWSLLDVFEVRGGKAASLCLFEVDDEEAAFGYAEERMRETQPR